MKKLKKIVTLLTLAAVCLTAPAFGKITVKAAEPNTYVLNFSPSKGEWRFKPASSWSEEVQDRELYYMMQEIKDGDYIVVQNDVDCNPLNLNVPVRLGNLTIKNSVKTPVITAKGYDNVYVLDGTTAAINGDVSHAYVYGGARVNFNNNVDTLEMYGYGSEYNNLHAYINVVGTVNHLSAKDGQTMETYYDYYNLPYTFLYVGGTSQTNYHFTTNCKEKEQIDYDFKSLIHILEDEKMNLIGDMEFDLSKNWYVRNQNNIVIKKLKNNIENFFRNKRKTKTEFNMWTTFSDFKKKLSSKGYGRGFVALNMRASNNYKHKTSIAYPVNRYMNTGIKNFFVSHNVDVDEDGFAVSEMLQFIWRSAIREGNEIWIYIPSSRMRGLLSKWIEENTVSFKKQT